MSRKSIFDAIKAERGGKGWQIDEIRELDALLDRMGVPREVDPKRGGLFASTAAINLIKQFEGCKLTAYPDPGTGGDPWTIGWGATGAGIRPGVTWTQQQADERLVADVTRFAAGVAQTVGDAPTTQNQFDAMVSLSYNIGLGAFRDSTLLRLHKAGEYAGAGDQFARWNKAGGKVLNGLVRRRAAEAAMYRGQA